MVLGRGADPGPAFDRYTLVRGVEKRRRIA
jgi:hypothetical protein